MFGRGKMTLLHPHNRAILAYIRHDATDTILVVANLSSQPQRVELDLTAYTGMVPREMLRGGESPPIETGPYGLMIWLYSSGHTETRTVRSIRGVFDEPIHDENIFR